jgi:translocator protein
MRIFDNRLSTPEALDASGAGPPRTRPARGRDLVGLGYFLALTFGAGLIGAMFTFPNVGTWYATIQKPSWTPPDWVFGPVWNSLFLMMAVAAWLVWRRAGPVGAERALALFGLQLMLNAAWSGLFSELVVLWLAILATAIAFGRRHRLAAWLLAPYLAWVTYAGALNFAIWRLND